MVKCENSSIITFNALIQAGMQRQVSCLMAKDILISTFQLKCNILTSLPTNSVSIEQMVENRSPAGHSTLLSAASTTQRLGSKHRERQSFCATVRFMPSISCCLAETKPVSYLHWARALLLFCLASSRANSTFGLSLRFLWRPAGSCCLSSKWGPGSIFSTSSMLRHPGLAKTCVSRMLKGA